MGNSPAMCDAGALVLLETPPWVSHSVWQSPPTSITASGEPLEVVSAACGDRGAAGGSKPRAQDIDLFEIHEAFAATVVKTRREQYRRLVSQRQRWRDRAGSSRWATEAIMTGVG